MKAEELYEIIRIEVEKQVEQKLKSGGYVKSWIAIISSVSSGVAAVTLIGDNTNIIPNLKNKTNTTLNIGDVVYLHSTTSQLSNSYIAIKK